MKGREKLNNMSNEELAHMMSQAKILSCPDDYGFTRDNCLYSTCEECWLYALESEVEE